MIHAALRSTLSQRLAAILATPPGPPKRTYHTGHYATIAAAATDLITVIGTFQGPAILTRVLFQTDDTSGRQDRADILISSNTGTILNDSLADTRLSGRRDGAPGYTTTFRNKPIIVNHLITLTTFTLKSHLRSGPLAGNTFQVQLDLVLY